MNTEMANYLEAWRAGDISPSPAAAFIGSELVAFGDGFSEVQLEISGEHRNSFGTIQGGILCALADVAMGTAVATTLETGEQFSTTNLNSMFCRPATSGRLHAAARVLHRGRSTALSECEITCGETLVARMTCTCMIKDLKNSGARIQNQESGRQNEHK